MVYYIVTLQASLILLSTVKDVTLIKRRERDVENSKFSTLKLITCTIVIIGSLADYLTSIYEFVQMVIKIFGF